MCCRYPSRRYMRRIQQLAPAWDARVIAAAAGVELPTPVAHREVAGALRLVAHS
eukprot:CAMPEP_0175979312 /NCGR_PEP_ID=MMETSP0108-20121206/46154_1 /TAXON_ID=195067 ORGANISM="Goniomonas pacifica, Strain CCMP1869" /NCGR_SAMPLE_ID=MMETSP0108 /ASSEMBLY_ACC=CAM_ASM_000204 /LENGTH=53 /DNA_ID=CAMNT_0017309605 /DNA_START=27 /DNA_END=188 /DNA_ORIENTATION=-